MEKLQNQGNRYDTKDNSNHRSSNERKQEQPFLYMRAMHGYEFVMFNYILMLLTLECVEH